MSEKIIEKIQFLTQIHKSWDGSEQRMALRTKPRKFISYDYIGMETWQSQYLRMLTFGQQNQLIEFPLWHAACALEENQYKGQAVIKIPQKVLWQYRNVGSIELWTNDRLGGAKYNINYLTANGLVGLAKQLLSDWPAYSTTVIPVIKGVLQQEDKFVNLHSEITTMMLNIELIQNQNSPEFPPAWDEFHEENIPKETYHGLPATFMGSDLFRYEPPWLDDITLNFNRNANRIDNKTGIFRYDFKSLDTAETKQIQYVGISRAEVYNLQRFFIRSKGMFKSFYMPTWVNDFELVRDAPGGQIYLLVTFNLFWKYYAKSKRRKTIVVFYTGGTAEILKIAGYSVDGKYGKIYLENPLRNPVIKKKIAMISFLCRYRFGSDELVTDYETTEAATMDFTFVEVDE